MTERLRAKVAVIGGGPAGIAAAVRAAEAGADALLIDEAHAPGGQIWRQSGASADLPRRARWWLTRLSESGVRRLRATAVAPCGPGRLLLDGGNGGVELRYDALVVATGARELFLPFPGWTLPGVIGAGAAEALARGGASFEGARAIVAGSGPLLLASAAALADSGARLRVIAEQAPAARVRDFAWRLALFYPGKLAAAVGYRARVFPTHYRPGTWVAAARGSSKVQEVDLTDGRRTWTEPCDLLCSGFGLVANLELPRLLGCRIENGGVAVDEDQRTSVPGVFGAGEVTGIGGVDLALAEGQVAGAAAAGRTGNLRAARADRSRHRRFASRIERAFALRPELRQLGQPDTFVCRCEDVPLRALDPAWSAREAKLYTRAGMGPCQGRVCGPALRFLFGWEADAVRPPVSPVPLSTLRSIAGANADSGAEEVVS